MTARIALLTSAAAAAVLGCPQQRREPDRSDTHGRIRFMARAEGWAMVRRPGAAPFCITEKDWLALPTWSKPRA